MVIETGCISDCEAIYSYGVFCWIASGATNHAMLAMTGMGVRQTPQTSEIGQPRYDRIINSFTTLMHAD